MTESYIDTLKRHGIKLSLAMFLGSLLHTVLYYAALILYMIIAFLLIAMFSSVSSVLESDADQIAEDLASEPGGIVLIAVLLLLLLPVVLLPNSFWYAGSYGAASASVFRGEWSIGYFFTAGFRHLWRMFGQQVLLALFFVVPILLIAPFGALLAADGEASEAALVIFFSLFFILLLVLLFGYFWVSLHAPLILIVERTGVWDSIRLAFRLTAKKPGQTLLSGLIALGIFLGTYVLALLIIGLFALLNVLAGGNEVVQGIFAIFAFLIILFVIYFSLSASLLSIVHRYKTRLRSCLFPEDPNWEGTPVGATPGYAPNKW